jgi:hypothetical protein
MRELDTHIGDVYNQIGGMQPSRATLLEDQY